MEGNTRTTDTDVSADDNVKCEKSATYGFMDMVRPLFLSCPIAGHRSLHAYGYAITRLGSSSPFRGGSQGSCRSARPPPPPKPYCETHAGLVVRPSLSPLPLHIRLMGIRPGGSPLGEPLPRVQLAHCSSPRCLSPRVVLSLLLCGAYLLYRCFRRCCWFIINLLTQQKKTKKRVAKVKWGHAPRARGQICLKVPPTPYV